MKMSTAVFRVVTPCGFGMGSKLSEHTVSICMAEIQPHGVTTRKTNYKTFRPLKSPTIGVLFAEGDNVLGRQTGL
jgi:hypothetical protein